MKLKGLLDTLRKPIDSSNCSLASACNIPYSYALNALNSFKGVWVVHYRARDRMTKSSYGFISCQSNKKIALAKGNFITILRNILLCSKINVVQRFLRLIRNIRSKMTGFKNW